jgi:antibiotic biosynthesis monooxygenase (ABM) superfamily enzyme
VDRWCDIAIEWMRQADAALSAHDNNANVSVQANLASTLNAVVRAADQQSDYLTQWADTPEREALLEAEAKRLADKPSV